MLVPWPTKLLMADQPRRLQTEIPTEEAYYLTSPAKGYRDVLAQVKIIQAPNTQTGHSWVAQPLR